MGGGGSRTLNCKEGFIHLILKEGRSSTLYYTMEGGAYLPSIWRGGVYIMKIEERGSSALKGFIFCQMKGLG